MINKQVFLDVDAFATLFDMDGSASHKLAKYFEEFTRDEAIKVLFLDNLLIVVIGKILASGLSVEDGVLHYTIIKYILPRAFNITNMMEDELFLM